jgi:hypothetical protein
VHADPNQLEQDVSIYSRDALSEGMPRWRDAHDVYDRTHHATRRLEIFRSRGDGISPATAWAKVSDEVPMREPSGAELRAFLSRQGPGRHTAAHVAPVSGSSSKAGGIQRGKRGGQGSTFCIEAAV